MNKGIVLSFPRNKIILIVLVIIVGFLVVYFFPHYQPVTSWNYYGETLKFRQDLKEANKVPVYPSETRLYEILWNPKVTNITMVFIETNDTAYTAVEAFEITFKFKIAFGMFVSNRTLVLTTSAIDSFDNLPSAEENPFIVLVPPSMGDETAVRIIGHTIFIKAKSDSDPKAAIKNFDLATIKLIMTVLGIKV